MGLLDRVVDVFSSDHRYRDEVKEWQTTGQFPVDVVRTYQHDRVERNDLRRLQDLGYRVVKREQLFAAKREELFGRRQGGDIGNVSGGGKQPAGRQITYTRDQFV